MDIWSVHRIVIFFVKQIDITISDDHVIDENQFLSAMILFPKRTMNEFAERLPIHGKLCCTKCIAQ